MMVLDDLQPGQFGKVEYGGFGDGGVRTYVYVKLMQGGFLRVYSGHVVGDRVVFGMTHSPGIEADPHPKTPCTLATGFLEETCTH